MPTLRRKFFVGWRARNRLLLLYRRGWFFSLGSRSTGRGRFGGGHGFDGTRLTQWLDLHRLFAPSVVPDHVAAKYQAAFFDRYQLAVKKGLARINHIREFRIERRRFDHRGPTARRAKDAGHLHFVKQQHGRRLWRRHMSIRGGHLLRAITVDAHLNRWRLELGHRSLGQPARYLVLLERITARAFPGRPGFCRGGVLFLRRRSRG